MKNILVLGMVLAINKLGYATDVKISIYPSPEIYRYEENYQIDGHEFNSDINACDQEGRTELHRAAKAGSISRVKELLDNGADIEARDKHKETPLLEAAYAGHDAIVEILVERGANINAANNDGETALHWATMLGRDDLKEYLRARNARFGNSFMEQMSQLEDRAQLLLLSCQSRVYK